MISGDGDFLPSSVDKSMLYLSSRVQLKYSSVQSERSLFVHLLKYSIKFTIMKAQYLANVEIIIFSSLIIFRVKSHLCACCVCLYAPETKTQTWLSTNTVSLRQILRLY